jgi:hypothetical protein
MDSRSADLAADVDRWQKRVFGSLSGTPIEDQSRRVTL